MFLNRFKFYFNLFTLRNKLKKTKLILIDFDGVLTDGYIYLSNDFSSLRKFNVKDGLGIKLLNKASIKVGCITGSSSEIVKKRCKNLNIEIVELGVEDKAKALMKITKNLKIERENILFLGDDVNDLPVLKYVNLFIVPNDAHAACKKKASYISKFNGGNGFIREIADLVLISKGKKPFDEFRTRNEYAD